MPPPFPRAAILTILCCLGTNKTSLSAPVSLCVCLSLSLSLYLPLPPFVPLIFFQAGSCEGNNVICLGTVSCSQVWNQTDKNLHVRYKVYLAPVEVFDVAYPIWPHIFEVL